MATCSDIQPRLSEFADGGFDRAERAEIDAHLSHCPACRGLYQDLQRLRRAAAALGGITPPDHVWLQVAGQTRLDRPAGAPSSARPVRRAAIGQWAGLAAALVLVTIGTHYFTRNAPPAPQPATAGNPAATAAVERIAEELSLATKHYDKAIVELEALMKSESGTLDAQMDSTLKQMINETNVAIAESRQALEQKPTSESARESLFEALRRKVVVLQATVNLMNEMRKGNQTGAVEAAAAFGRKSS